MFYFKCHLTGGFPSTESLTRGGGVESLDLCRKFGLKETTNELRVANWNTDPIEVKIDESLARASGKFETSNTVNLKIPIALLKKGDLEVVDLAHNGGSIRLNHDLPEERLLQIIHATLLFEQTQKK